jgi:TfoX/Sxy family transcriptional regulator of competence genes
MHHRHILSWLTIAGVPERNDYFYPKSHSMAYNEHLAERIKQNLESRKIKYIEKKMFGGVCLMVDDKMLMGVMKDQLMARVDPEVDAPKALKRKGAAPMDFTGKTMKGFILVDEEAIDMEEDFDYWVSLCLKYNPKAKASKKKQRA